MSWTTGRILIATAGVVGLAFLSSAWGGNSDPSGTYALEPSGRSDSIARCTGFIGQGSKDWRKESIVAGPVGVNREPAPLSFMTRTPDNALGTKMGLLIEGQDRIRISIPNGSQRILLMYGRKAGTVYSNRGFRSIVFVPCEGNRRTIFPGGIKVKGRRAVRLKVSREDGSESWTLKLGRPRPLTVTGRDMNGWITASNQTHP